MVYVFSLAAGICVDHYHFKVDFDLYQIIGVEIIAAS
jgi:hypothetical protein